MELQPGEPFFIDEVNPTATELTTWAYADAYAPWEDFHMVLDTEETLPVVVSCAEDPRCPSRTYLLMSLYCTVGHLGSADRARVRAVAAGACASGDPAVRTWARRAVAVIDGVAPLDRADWCGSPSLAFTDPVDP